MAYRLTLDELATSAATCAHEQLGDAVAQLERLRPGPDAEAATGDDAVTAVHEARKDLKKARALLRLLRERIDADVRRAENAALRDAARTISAARDADVMVQSAEALREQATGQVPAATLDALVEALQARSRDQRVDAGAAIGPALEALRAADVRVDDWAPARLRRRDLVAGIGRAYADGDARRREAVTAPTPEALHEWRKRVKDLWYHQRLLGDAWPAVLEAQAAESKVLSELLGDDHDLAVLADALPELDLVAGSQELLEVVAHRRAELQREAFALGARIYAERPAAMRRRLHAWLAAESPSQSPA